MGKPAQFPTNGSNELAEREVDAKISRLIAPLANGNSGLVLLMIPGHQAFVSSKFYSAESGRRQLFVITERSDVIAYMDLGLDHAKQTATCGDRRNSKAPTGFGNLNGLNSSGDGFACCDATTGELLVGLTVYALKQESITALKVVEYKPAEGERDIYSAGGTQKADFQIHTYNHVSDEVRNLVAESLHISSPTN